MKNKSKFSKNDRNSAFGFPYLCLTRKGRCDFPTREITDARIISRVRTTLILDANVCIDLRDYISAECYQIKPKTQSLLLAISKCGLDTTPIFGCLELACQAYSGEINDEMFQKLLRCCFLALDQDPDDVALGIRSEVRTRSPVTGLPKNINLIQPLHLFHYCCTLKITEIWLRGRGRKSAIENYLEYFDWCEQCKTQSGLAQQTALAVFGGAKDADSLIALQHTKPASKTAWASAWDLTPKSV